MTQAENIFTTHLRSDVLTRASYRSKASDLTNFEVLLHHPFKFSSVFILYCTKSPTPGIIGRAFILKDSLFKEALLMGMSHGGGRAWEVWVMFGVWVNLSLLPVPQGLCLQTGLTCSVQMQTLFKFGRNWDQLWLVIDTVHTAVWDKLLTLCMCSSKPLISVIVYTIDRCYDNVMLVLWILQNIWFHNRAVNPV